MKIRIYDVDSFLSKAIRFVVVLSLAVHSFLLIQNSSKSTGGWLDTISNIQYLEDLPTVLTFTNTTSLEVPTSNAVEVIPEESPYSLTPLDVRPPTFVKRIPLAELIESNTNVTCNPGQSKKRIVNSTILPDHLVYSDQRKIPKIVHITSKTKCLTPTFIKNVDNWRLPGYALYFHDDVAVDRLLAKYSPDFPHLRLIQQCTISGAAKADLWRLLVLWEYGGIYADLDSAPGPLFENGTVIKDDDDAWFVVEQIGVMSQYFMSSSPKHPFLHIAITHTLKRILDVDNISKQYVPFVTGPGGIKGAMIYFMNDEKNFQRVTQGKYFALDGWSVTVEGARGTSHKWIKREAVTGIQKRGGYTAMGMKHFGDKSGRHKLPRDSCYLHLYRQYNKVLEEQEALGIKG